MFLPINLINSYLNDPTYITHPSSNQTYTLINKHDIDTYTNMDTNKGDEKRRSKEANEQGIIILPRIHIFLYLLHRVSHRLFQPTYHYQSFSKSLKLLLLLIEINVLLFMYVSVYTLIKYREKR